MTPEQAFMVALFAAFLTHNFTSKRFKNELKVKKEEKIINDAKELVSEFEKKLLTRIHLTRDYLYALKQAKNDAKEVDEELRKNYRTLIKDWNLNFDFLSTTIFRNGVLRSRKELDDLQASLRKFHLFFVKWADIPNEVPYDSIDKKLDDLNVFQNECNTIMFNVTKKIDARWDDIFIQNGFFKKIMNISFDYIFKTLIIYLFVNIILFSISCFLR